MKTNTGMSNITQVAKEEGRTCSSPPNPAIEKALHQMLSECSKEDLLEMIEIFGDCYLESCTGGVNMHLIYRQRQLTFFLNSLEDSHKEKPPHD